MFHAPSTFTGFAIISVVVLFISLFDVLRRDTVRGGHKWIWIAVIVILGLPGQLLYFLIGRGKGNM